MAFDLRDPFPRVGLAPEDQKNYCRLLLMAEGKEAGCAMEDWPCVQREQVRASEEQLLCDT